MDLLAYQVLLPLPARMQTLRTLAGFTRATPVRLPGPAMADTLNRIAVTLDAALDDVVYGFWELTTDDDGARDEYDQWVEGTWSDAIEEAEQFEPGAEAFGFVTLLLLIEPESEAAAQLWRVIDAIEEGEEWTRDSFRALLSCLPALALDGVGSVVVFVRPGRGGHGLMASLLREEHYHHLSPVL